MFVVFFFKQKPAYELRIIDWSSDVCSSDLVGPVIRPARPIPQQIREFEIAISVFDVLRCDPRLDLGHYWPLMNVARTIGSCSPCSSTGYVADCTRSAI